MNVVRLHRTTQKQQQVSRGSNERDTGMVDIHSRRMNERFFCFQAKFIFVSRPSGFVHRTSANPCRVV